MNSLNNVTPQSRPGKSSTLIYQKLKRLIIENKLPIDQSIKQDQIAEQYGVSKIPVREALKRLEAEGLVDFIPRRGAFVVELSEFNILEIMEIRYALESHALAIAIPNMVDKDFVLAEKVLKNYEKAKTVSRWSQLNNQFHDCLYTPCGLPRLISLIASNKERISPFLRLKTSQVSGLSRPHKEHIAILNACKNQNIKMAVRLNQQHIKTTKKEIVAYFRQQRVKRGITGKNVE